MSRILTLWVVPRSRSTAFERMMRERGDLKVVHEPFVAYYYYSEDRVSDHYNEGIEPDPSHDYRAILKRVLEEAAEAPVFFKDMAYHLSRCMSAELVANFHNTFLIRDPRLTLPSLYRLQPEATLEETGFEQQLRLMRIVRDELGQELVVVDAEELGRDPAGVTERYCEQVGLPFIPEALEWDPGEPSEEWEPWRKWHREAIQSTGFEPRPDAEEKRRDEVEVPADIQARCEEIYDEILALAGSAAARS